MRNILLTALPGKTPTLQKPFPEMARAPLPNQALDLFGLVFVQVMMPVPMDIIFLLICLPL